MESVEFPQTPSLIVGSVSHARSEPVRHAFKTSHYQWLVDLDELPDLGFALRPLSRFHASDHLSSGAHGNDLKHDAVAAFARFGVVHSPEDRLLMLAHARVFGHVFDPLTVFWSVAPSGEVKGILLEVHNTYGERHCYFVEPDRTGAATIEKDFRVSPFNDLEGSYDVRIEVGADALAVTIGLTRRGQRLFSAGVRGEAVPATRASLVRVATRHFLMTQKVSMLIRLHGVRLWLAGLPVLARAPRHHGEAR